MSAHPVRAAAVLLVVNDLGRATVAAMRRTACDPRLVVIGLGAGAAVAVRLDELAGPAVALALLAAPLALMAVLCLPGLRRLDRDLAAPVRQVAPPWVRVPSGSPPTGPGRCPGRPCA